MSVRKAQFIANKIAIQIVPTSELGWCCRNIARAKCAKVLLSEGWFRKARIPQMQVVAMASCSWGDIHGHRNLVVSKLNHPISSNFPSSNQTWQSEPPYKWRCSWETCPLYNWVIFHCCFLLPKGKNQEFWVPCTSVPNAARGNKIEQSDPVPVRYRSHWGGMLIDCTCCNLKHLGLQEQTSIPKQKTTLAPNMSVSKMKTRE
jgi:hypothetical protein